MNSEEDIAALTIMMANDPRTMNRLVIYRPPSKNSFSGPFNILGLQEKCNFTYSYLMYWDNHLIPSPYPIFRMILHINTSIGRTLESDKFTLPLPVV